MKLSWTRGDNHEPGDADQLCDRALATYGKGDVPGALLLWEQAASLGSGRGALNLAVEASKQGDVAEYVAQLLRTIQMKDSRLTDGLSRRAEGGDPGAQQLLDLLTMVTGVSDADTKCRLGSLALGAGDADVAASMWTEAADEGSAEAANCLGIMSREQGDLNAASRWWTIAAGLGSDGAMVELGVDALDAGDLPRARDWLTRAAEAGNVQALHVLAHLALREDDVETARSLWLQAAALDDAAAMYDLGLLAFLHDDARTADDWLSRATEVGCADAWLLLNAVRAGGTAASMSPPVESLASLPSWKVGRVESIEIGIPAMLTLVAAARPGDVESVTNVLWNGDFKEAAVQPALVQLILLMSRSETMLSAFADVAEGVPEFCRPAFETALACARNHNAGRFSELWIPSSDQDSQALGVLFGVLAMLAKVDPAAQPMLSRLTEQSETR